MLLQNDLTAIAAGPLTPDAARELGALADVESRGGATVYRFTVESLRRAHALGWSSAEIRTTLEARSRTPIPQPLSYLVADLDRIQPVVVGPAPGDLRSAPPSNHQQPVRASATPLAGSANGVVIDAQTATHIVAGAAPLCESGPG